MNDEVRQQKVRDLAQMIWEREGRPEGRAEQHWSLAERQIEADEQTAAESQAEENTGQAKKPLLNEGSGRARADMEGNLGPLLPVTQRAIIPPAMDNEERRKDWQLDEAGNPGPYMIELNLFYISGLSGAEAKFKSLFKQEEPQPIFISKTYFRCDISFDLIRTLIRRDEDTAGGDERKRAIYKIWPDFPIKATIDRSVATVKADAAYRSFAATGAGIVWAVIDSGIDARHPHFGHQERNKDYRTLTHPDVSELHRDFTDGQALPDPEGEPEAVQASIAKALIDEYGHGTHVAGIVAGGIPESWKPDSDFRVYENRYVSDPSGRNKAQVIAQREDKSSISLRGVAPQCKLISLKVLNATGGGRTSDIIRALHYIRVNLNGDPKLLRVHGVNLSVGYEFDAEMFACGQSPLCVEVDRLVKSGVVVVASAGNTGYGKLTTELRPTRVGLSNTINDPGNAANAITVGATHRDSPHTYGVSYFSSKGPTGDGRLKPDLVAPGERITSCAAGRYLARKGGRIAEDLPAYVDESGTSMAAPHVSGAIAAFLCIRREFIQRPEDVKRIFLESATSLGRERYFEGHGLVDLMRAIQSV